jgi:hypothetical protein
VREIAVRHVRGRGWCVIVYTDAVRNIVLVTQPI